MDTINLKRYFPYYKGTDITTNYIGYETKEELYNSDAVIRNPQIASEFIQILLKHDFFDETLIYQCRNNSEPNMKCYMYGKQWEIPYSEYCGTYKEIIKFIEDKNWENVIGTDSVNKTGSHNIDNKLENSDELENIKTDELKYTEHKKSFEDIEYIGDLMINEMAPDYGFSKEYLAEIGYGIQMKKIRDALKERVIDAAFQTLKVKNYDENDKAILLNKHNMCHTLIDVGINPEYIAVGTKFERLYSEYIQHYVEPVLKDVVIDSEVYWDHGKDDDKKMNSDDWYTNAINKLNEELKGVFNEDYLNERFRK